jgi:hypothetical protein
LLTQARSPLNGDVRPGSLLTTLHIIGGDDDDFTPDAT